MHEILNTLVDQIAILDESATIIDANVQWQKIRPNSIGSNFLQIHEKETRTPETKAIRQAIQRLIGGDDQPFSCQYENNERQWFSLQVTTFHHDDTSGILVSIRAIQPTVVNRKTEQNIEQLSETNFALNTLLKSREQDRKIQEGAIVSNVQQLIMPYVKRLSEAPIGPQEQTLVRIIEEYLDNIISPFLHHISSLNQQLTPQELKVASLIRQGRSTKEISEALGLSVHGVGFHRKSIRTKLGLTGSGKNLRSQLMALR